MFLETSNRKGEKVVFATANDLYDSIFEMDAVTLGKTLAVLPETGHDRIWFAAYDAHNDKARVAGKLRTVVTNIMNRAAEAQDAKTAKEAARRLDPFTDPEAWWAGRTSAKEIDLEALTADVEVEPAPQPTRVVSDETGATLTIVDDTKPTADDKMADLDAKREALRAKVEAEKPAKAPRVKKDPKDVKPRVRARDEGPTESLGTIEIEREEGDPIVVEDFYGDGSYLRTCVPCDSTLTYAEGFGWRILKGAKVVQPQCKACRRKASKLWAAKKKAEALAEEAHKAEAVEGSEGKEA